MSRCVEKGDGKMTDNVATLQGFTKEILIVTKDRVIFAIVRPETKFTGTYRA
jgi:hypothetical protein